MVRELAESIGKGAVAGFAGTVAMTVSSTVEQKLRRRPPSAAPARAAERVLGIESFESDATEERFSNLVHWGYGTGWGIVRGLLRAVGFAPQAATALHLAAVWGTEQVMLPTLDVAPPLFTWGGREIAIDLWHHVVYAVATGVAYDLVEGGD
ncbi:MAG: hypothetical protein M3N16_07190 [Actinomycetota bacterium]|nr:hypothetical protein [Actinomycetota bacterium]